VDEGGAMAKARGGEGGKRMGRPPSGLPRIPVALTIRGTDHWKQWVVGYAEETGLDYSELVAVALAEKARREKRLPPPSRT
jgi:hypothetical protein